LSSIIEGLRINKTILHLPPYISTPWKNVSSLFVEKENNKPILVIILQNGSHIRVPNLDQKTIDTIYEMHAKHLEEEPLEKKQTQIGFGLPLGLDANNMEAFTSAMQHNPEQSNAPDLPDEILKKISGIAKVLGEETSLNVPKPESNCNCVHCQIARAIHGMSKEQNEIEDEITDEDLRFREWDIKQTSDKIYIVTNPLNKEESYQVYLGIPLGCTCGNKNCAHIQAVLRS